MVFTPLSRFRSVALTVVACLCVFFAAASARAQLQESGTLDRITNPDRTLHYSPADKQFTVSSSVADRQAVVKPFAFGKSASFHSGDGAFSTRPYSGKDAFHTEAFSTRTATAVKQDFAQTGKTFSTKSVDVHEDRAANKAMPVQQYAPFERPFLGRGKRQDTIDELRKQKNMTIDQVRELLNKNK